EGGHPRGVPAQLYGVVFRGEVATAPPGFVADAPVDHFQRVALALGRARLRHARRAGRRIAELDPLVPVARWEAADVGGDVRLRTGQPAEAGELHGSEVVRIVLRWRGRDLRVDPEVRARRAALSRP